MRNLIKFFITVIIIFSTFSSHSKDLNLPKNLIIHEKLKKYENVSFKNRFDKDINLANFNGKLLLLNFWATWCEPCKEEMPLCVPPIVKSNIYFRLQSSSLFARFFNFF